MKKAIVSIVLGILATLVAANVASACFWWIYQPTMPTE